MIFTPTGVAGAWVIDVEPARDERGFFARTWCAEEFAMRGLRSRISQRNVSFNAKRHTLRGMHYQVEPFEEAKVVSCRAGSVHDVIVDLRPGSGTYRASAAVELSAANRRMLWIPPGFAHGFLTLEDDTEVDYLMMGTHDPAHARGVRWDDPALAITWPASPAVVSERDRSFPDLASTP